MKKTLLAAALIAGFAGVAKAETSVILYGIVDTGVAYEEYKTRDANGNSLKSTRTGLKDGGLSGNRWGLKGSEDLGDGLRANFRLESGFNLSNGSSAQGGRLFGRWATVGVSGDSWGSLDFGRQDNVASRFFVDAYGTGNWDTGAVQAFGGGVDGLRLDNSVVYVTPSFEGFQAAVGYTFKHDGTQDWKVKGEKDQNSSGWTAGLRYANGPIELAGTYDNIRLGTEGTSSTAFTTLPVFDNAGTEIGSVNVPGATTTTYNKFKRASSYTVSGAYDFEVVKLSLAFGQSFDGYYFLTSDNDLGGSGYAKKYDVNSYAVSLSAPVGDGTLAGTYNLAQPRKLAKTDLHVDANGDAIKSKKQHNFGLAYTYPISKRTTVYAIGGYTKNVDFSDNGKRTVAGVGVRHAF